MAKKLLSSCIVAIQLIFLGCSETDDNNQQRIDEADTISQVPEFNSPSDSNVPTFGKNCVPKIGQSPVQNHTVDTSPELSEPNNIAANWNGTQLSFSPKKAHLILIYEGEFKNLDEALVIANATARVPPQIECKEKFSRCVVSPITTSVCFGCENLRNEKRYSAFVQEFKTVNTAEFRPVKLTFNNIQETDKMREENCD